MKIKVNGVNLHYCIDGPQNAPWVTLSNSLATTHQMWEPQMEALTKNYRVLRYDKRGHGESEATPGPYSFELLADDVFALLEALQITHTHFVGLSMGGMTGMTMALKKPGVLRTLVLCDTASQDPLGDPKLWQQRIDAVNVGGMVPMVEMTVARFLTADTIMSQPTVADAVRQMVRATSTVGYSGCCQALSKLALSDRISAITLPTLVVVGAEDPATNVGMAKGIQERIAGSELVIIERAAHLSNMDQPAAFSAAVLGFLARH